MSLDWIEESLQDYFEHGPTTSPLGPHLSERQLREFAGGTASEDSRAWAIEHLVTCRMCADQLQEALRPAPIFNLEWILASFRTVVNEIMAPQRRVAMNFGLRGGVGTKRGASEELILVSSGHDFPEMDWSVLEDSIGRRTLRVSASAEWAGIPVGQSPGIVLALVSESESDEATSPNLRCEFLALRRQGDRFSGETSLPPKATLRRADDDEVAFPIDPASIPDRLANRVTEARQSNIDKDGEAASTWDSFCERLPESTKSALEKLN